ncbi:peptidoglycan DD-metalloendopeptidase family protein [Microbacterium trichothecenolyticum]|uniref:Glycyl-glycine endopeptidase ALE-1 n=1 Tax=Microbacterium trichothecenolyticum TaxID=69370 RepID=A0A0M2H0J7_MICTR|nr:peptidoglycan DD-metalloendopeptidase family protein [Microbacterium trichothecenolyticum]KJL39901.1 Glycyl-glycine endopeptidase ALE-1 precursor [Microbacterium trichothecenolyticum]
MLPLPFAASTIGGRFGDPRPNGRKHLGLDFGVPRGSDIRASGTGFVRRKGKSSLGGNFCTVAYSNGLDLVYYHSDVTFPIAVNARVEEGTFLGDVGSLGADSTGPHLHLEAYWFPSGTAVDPLGVLGGRTVGQALPSTAGEAFPARKLYGAGWVLFLQDLLIAFGHAPGRDGEDGAKTQASVAHEQTAAKANGYGTIKVDGIGGQETLVYLLWAFLRFRAKPENVAGQPARMRYGKPWVALIQRLLNELGHGLTVDGEDGAKTQAAVRHEQTASRGNGYPALGVDGVAGFETAKYLVWAIVKFALPWS